MHKGTSTNDFYKDLFIVNFSQTVLRHFFPIGRWYRTVTVSLPIEASVALDESETEVLSFIEWSENNCTKDNLTKTWNCFYEERLPGRLLNHWRL